jgi:peptidoglycan/LPS O-acetylase OafA/YrhL
VKASLKDESAGTRRPRIASLQICRGIAALAVVSAHLHDTVLKFFHRSVLDIFQFGPVGVDIFFVTSGIVISSVAAGKFGSRAHASNFMYRRLVRIYPVFWIYSTIVLMVYLCRPGWTGVFSGHPSDVVRSFLLVPGDYSNLVLQAWTLTFEVLFYWIFFFLILMLTERTAHIVLFAWGCLIGAVGLLHARLPGVFNPFVNPLILEFLAGCFIFYIYNRFPKRRFIGRVLLLAALFWFGCIVRWTIVAHGSDATWATNHSWPRVSSYGVFAALLLLGLMQIEVAGHSWSARVLHRMGDWSYSIYLSHIIVIAIVARSLVVLTAPFTGAYILFLVTASAASIAVGFVSFTWVERPLTERLYRYAPGKRRARRPGVSDDSASGEAIRGELISMQ